TCDREDRQLAGLEPTLPEGAVHDERVAPARQGCQQFPALVRRALKEGWDVPDANKAKVVAELLAGALDPDTATGRRIRQDRTLLLADQTQYEAELQSRAEGGAVGVSVQANVQAAALIREMIERGDLPDTRLAERLL